MNNSHAGDPEAVESDPFPAISQRRRRGVQVTSAAAIALGLILSGGAVAGAATPPSPPTGSPRPAAPSGQQRFDGAGPIALGTVKTVGDASFTICAQDGTTVTVRVDRSTTYVDPDVTSQTIASVTVGDQVAVFGTEASGSVTATRVAVGIPMAGGRGEAGGGWAGPGRSSGGWAEAERSSGSGPVGSPGGDPGSRPDGGPWGRDWAPANSRASGS
jgi:hypothetical protein